MEADEDQGRAAEGTYREGKRLHPMTLLQRFLVSIPALLFLLLPVLQSPDSTAWLNLAFAVLYGVLVLPWIVLYYLRFRYWISDEEITIHSGVLTRRRRNIPVDRIQNIEIERPLLPRMFGTAKVAVYTAGSSNAEGVLEYVSVDEAKSIKRIVRRIQAREEEPGLANGESESVPHDSAPLADVNGRTAADDREEEAAAGDLLLDMSTQRVLLAGAFRFSLIYIAVIFSFLQYIEPDPAQLGRMLGDPVAEAVEGNPIMAGISISILAVFLGWLTGIAMTVNRYLRFRLSLDGDKLLRRHGLLTLTEGAIPLRRIQSFILRSNPLMKHYGWYRFELQTLGIDLQQSGYQVAVPFGRLSEIGSVIDRISGVQIPTEWQSVSKLTIRRFAARSTVAVIVVVGVVRMFWAPAIWGFSALPLLYFYGVLRYLNMGYAVGDDAVAVRRGVFRKTTWIIPYEKLQAVFRRASFFQRRLGLESFFVDTAGSSPMQPADLVDVPEGTSDGLEQAVYSRFRSLKEHTPR